MKKCIICPAKIPDDAPPMCEECLDYIDALNEPSKDLAKEIVDLEDSQLPF